MEASAWIMLVFAIIFLGGGLWFGLSRTARTEDFTGEDK